MKLDETQITNVFSAIGQSTRLDILKSVAPYSRGPDAQGLAAGEIAKQLTLAPPTLSFHLKDMTFKGLLIQQRQGRVIRYRANLDVLLESLNYLVSEICEA